MNPADGAADGAPTRPAGETADATVPASASSSETAASSASPLLFGEGPGGRIGRYRLLQILGEGGMGTVFLAEQEEPVRRQVALKVIKPGIDTRSVVARFEAERQALALMDHPHIAKVLDAGATDNGRPYFVMELVRGISITEYCDRNHLSPSERVDLFIYVCHAIQHAHQKGIIHRDIKPSNLLVSVKEGARHPMVIDFGIAKALHQRLTDKTLLTHLSQMIGTPAYMSPEQAELTNLDIDTRSDVYSLGVVLYELLTGSTPFATRELLGGGLGAMQRVLAEREPPKPSTRISTLSGEDRMAVARNRGTHTDSLISLIRGDLDWIVMKALEKDRTRRYPTVNSLVDDLQRYRTNQPVSAVAPTVRYRFAKFYSRNRRSVHVAAMVAFSLIIASIVSITQAIRATRAQHRAVMAEAAEHRQFEAAVAERDRAREAQKIAERERTRADTERAAAERAAYSAGMLLAQSAWQQGDVAQVERALDETAQYPDRGFEWFRLFKLARLDFSLYPVHEGSVGAVAFSPDGRHLLSGSSDGTARLQEVAGMRPGIELRGHLNGVYTLAFSPDGRLVATGSDDQSIRLWDPLTGSELRRFRGHFAAVSGLAFSPDGSTLASASLDRTVRLWDVSSGRPLRILRSRRDAIRGLAWIGSSDRLATANGDGSVGLWSISNGQELAALMGHKGAVFAVASSRDGRVLASAGADGTARLWDATELRARHVLSGNADAVQSIALSPDGRLAASGGLDRSIRIWDVESGKEVQSGRGQREQVLAVAFSPDGHSLASGNARGTIGIWDFERVRSPRTLAGHQGRIWMVTPAPAGDRIVSAGEDGTVRVWETSTGREVLVYRGHKGAAIIALFMADGRTVASAGEDRGVRIWDAATGVETASFQDSKGRIWGLACSPDGLHLASSGTEGAIKLWSVAEAREVAEIRGHEGAIVWWISWSPDGRFLATGGADATACIWDVATRSLRHTLRGHREAVSCVEFLPDGKTVATSSNDRTIRFWSLDDGRELLTVNGHSSVVGCIAASPDGRRLASASADRTIKIWDVLSGRELLGFSPSAREIWTVRFSHDGRRLFSGSDDGVIRIWDSASIGDVDRWNESARLSGVARTLAPTNVASRTAKALAPSREERVTRVDRWLVLGPAEIPQDRSGFPALEEAYLAGESKLRPKAGESGTIGGSGFAWKATGATNGVLDFHALGVPSPVSGVGYAVAYVHVPEERRGLSLHVDARDLVRIRLNDETIHEWSAGERWHPQPHESIGDVALRAGLNTLVLKVVNVSGGWGDEHRVSVAFAEPGDTPATSPITLTLDPDIFK